MKKVVLALTLLVVSFGYSQTRGQYDIASGLGGRGQVFDFGRKADARENVNGSPYFVDTYLPVKLSNFENENILVRYNAAEDEMEFRKDGQIYYVPKSDDLSVKFLNSGKEYHYTSYTDKGNVTSGYLILVSENEKVSLFKREQIKFVAAKEAANSYDTGRPAEYKKADDAFFLELNGTIENFPKNKKELIRKFSHKEKEVAEFLKQNKTSFSREADLVQLTKFLSTL
jgi:hypothetical protein